MDNQTNKGKNINRLSEAYKILKFTDAETKEALNDLAVLQRLAMTTVFLEDLTKEEIGEIGKHFSDKSEEEKQKEAESLFSKRYSGELFRSKIEAAVDKVIQSRVDYLETRGDGQQREQLAAILAF